MPVTTTRRAFLAMTATALAAPGGLHAQTFPTRPIAVVVPFAAGGLGDTVVRVMSDALVARLGQPVVVENRTGANGAIGTIHVANASPDGHTLLLATPGQLSIHPLIEKNLGFSTERDLTPVSGLIVQPLFLVTNAALPAQTVADLLRLARDKTQKLSYGSSGNGAMSHLLGATLSAEAGNQCVHVPYRGNAPSTLALLGNEVQFLFMSATEALKHRASGKIRLLGVTGTARWPTATDVPTLHEAGLSSPVFGFQFWLGLFGPAGMSPQRLAQLEGVVHAVLGDPSVQARFAEMEVQPWTIGSEALRALLRAEATGYAQVLSTTQLKL